jgi:polysaccharide export outer membrane protein
MNSTRWGRLLLCSAFVTLSGCAGWLPTSGPSTKQLEEAVNRAPDHDFISLMEIDLVTTQRLQASEKRQQFAEVFGVTRSVSYVANPGDMLEVSIWEASPAMLFGSAPSALSSVASGRSTTLPEQMVGQDGLITVPFAGRIRAAKRTLSEIEVEITRVLQGKANMPQVMVRMTRNTTSNATVVGEVRQSVMLPLTPKGERVLDAVAAAGGVSQSVEKITVQLARQAQVHSMPLEKIIQDPKQNIRLSPGDVLTAFYQPYSFTALGATGKNDELKFEAHGISLSQALGRVGGVQDNRTDPRGVYIFRFEDRTALPRGATLKAVNAEGKVPVVYRLDLSDPAGFFLAQGFPIKNKDVLYVANASSVELQKFLNIMVSVIYPIVNTVNIVNGY